LGSDDEDVYQEEQMDFDYGLGNTIVVDNLPVVPKEKFDKLEGVINKIYSQIGVIKEDGLWMPVDPGTQKTLGYCFIEYNTPQVIIFPMVYMY
jgi:translation initiation factor 3 subunit B